MRTNWTSVIAAKRVGGEIARVWPRVVKPTGWGGGYKRKPPQGAHKCLNRAEMKLLLSSWK
jgi:hypothetical protein